MLLLPNGARAGARDSRATGVMADPPLGVCCNGSYLLDFRPGVKGGGMVSMRAIMT